MRNFYVFYACVIGSFGFAACASAGEPLFDLEKIKSLVDVNGQIVNLLIVPAIVWTVGFIKDHISAFLKNRNYNRALKVYQAALAAVDWVYTNSVHSQKAGGQKLTETAATVAMDAAQGKLKEIAEKENITSLLPQDPVNMKLLIEQAIADRKNGTLTATFLNLR